LTKMDTELGFREEVLNVKLAEILSLTGLLSIPESIVKEGEGKRLPDVTMGDYWGVRVVIEGKIADKVNARELLEKDCLRRIEEGIAALAVGIVYPSALRHANWVSLEQDLQRATFQVKVYSEGGGNEWIETNIEGLSATLRRAYESLVKEDVVNAAVDELRQGIEAAAVALSSSQGTAERLKGLLMQPTRQETEER
jgi:hypothetical protein